MTKPTSEEIQRAVELMEHSYFPDAQRAKALGIILKLVKNPAPASVDIDAYMKKMRLTNRQNALAHISAMNACLVTAATQSPATSEENRAALEALDKINSSEIFEEQCGDFIQEHRETIKRCLTAQQAPAQGWNRVDAETWKIDDQGQIWTTSREYIGKIDFTMGQPSRKGVTVTAIPSQRPPKGDK